MFELPGTVYSLDVEEKYSGPRLEADGSVTLSFMKELLEEYKIQGKLHTKFAFQVLRSTNKIT